MNVNNLSQFFKDESGQFSAIRLAFLGTLFCFLVGWSIQSIHEKKIVPIDSSLLYLIGILTTGKVTQSFSENGSSKSVTNNPPTP